MRGATCARTILVNLLAISTHTPHAGRDLPEDLRRAHMDDFNSHAPCGARRLAACRDFDLLDISTHTPHAGRDYVGGVNYELFTTFQLTRPMRGATDWCGHCVSRLEFQLTRPMRGATPPRKRDGKSRRISTHTPHAGRDEAYA